MKKRKVLLKAKEQLFIVAISLAERAGFLLSFNNLNNPV